jgi:uracil-DNA glycosylase
MHLPQEWVSFLNTKINVDEFEIQLKHFLDTIEFVIPSNDKIFNVFRIVNPKNVRCVLFGEDPYPRISSACGVAFWDKEINCWDDKTNGNSLKNIMKAILVSKGEASYNTGIAECREIARSTNFISPPDLFNLWLNEGVLLLNTALTFSSAADKKKHFLFWREFNQSVISALNQRDSSPFYILWGSKAQKWESHILKSIDDSDKIIKQGHPTFIHQFLDKNKPQFSPFTEIIDKTKLTWY